MTIRKSVCRASKKNDTACRFGVACPVKRTYYMGMNNAANTRPEMTILKTRLIALSRAHRQGKLSNEEFLKASDIARREYRFEVHAG